jgi:uncharacterized protein (TIGR03382 family)
MRVAAIVLIAVACRHPSEPVSEREREPEHHVHRHVTRPTSTASRLRIAELAASETARERRRSAPEAAWTSLGPFSGDTIDQTGVLSAAESGLVEGIRLDPRDANVVFIATAGGGIWRTTDITAQTPDWQPITDKLGKLGIGAFDIDPHHADTIVVGVGEPFYEPGGYVQVTRDGGASWSAPVALGAATNFRDLRIDPGDSSVILAATDVGLFRSVDGGMQWSAIDLPNGSVALEEAVWSVVYTGRDASGSHWAVSAVAACDVGLAPPQESSGLPPSASCRLGNPGDIWHSNDGGATWTKSVIPVSTNSSGVVSRAGRMALAAGDPSDPATTVVYAMVANRDDSHSQTIDILRSNDGGATFVSAKGTVTNPDTVCVDLDVGSVQSGYNQAIAVDPRHPERVVVAGLFCSVRSVDGTSASPSWQVVSDVYGPQTSTSCGPIPYVHSDFHAALIAPNGRVLLGGDGGLEASDDALSVAAGSECSTRWIDANRGLATHMSYTITSGDPAYGDGDVIFTGMQDLSSRWRDSAHPGQWNTINLSDGTGGAVVRSGDATIYWTAQVAIGGLAKDRAYCRREPGTDCGLLASWTPANPTLPADDTEAFVTLLAPLDPEGAVISHSAYHVWRADASAVWSDITGKHCEPDGTCTTGSFSPYYINSVTGSPAAGVYGVAMFDHTAVTSDGGATWTISAPLGIDGRLLGYTTSYVAIPKDGGGDVYVVGSSAEVLADGTPVPDDVGHLLITRDRGRTWTSLAGAGLPNVPVWGVKYDPRDPRGLVVATELGVYHSADAGATWTRLGAGLPMVRVTDLALASDGSFVRISTWGRGVWELAIGGDGKGDGDSSGATAGCGCQGGGANGFVAVAIFAILLRRRR